MALAPLMPADQAYDTVSGELVLTFHDAAPADYPDPTSFTSGQQYVLRIKPTNLSGIITPIEQ